MHPNEVFHYLGFRSIEIDAPQNQCTLFCINNTRIILISVQKYSRILSKTVMQSMSTQTYYVLRFSIRFARVKIEASFASDQVANCWDVWYYTLFLYNYPGKENFDLNVIVNEPIHPSYHRKVRARSSQIFTHLLLRKFKSWRFFCSSRKHLVHRFLNSYTRHVCFIFNASKDASRNRSIIHCWCWYCKCSRRTRFRANRPGEHRHSMVVSRRSPPNPRPSDKASRSSVRTLSCLLYWRISEFSTSCLLSNRNSWSIR